MFTITSNNLNKINSNYSSQSRITTGNHYFARLAAIGFNSQETLSVANIYGNEITLPDDVGDVTTIFANGQILLPALDPQNPQQGEYIYNPYTKKVTVYSYSQSVNIFYSPVSVTFAPRLTRTLPTLFLLLPLEGQVSLSRSFENHPTGSFSFETHYTKDQVMSILAPGREFSILDIGYRVNNISCSELPRSIYPDGRIKVSVSLGGKWENRLNQPCFLRQDGKNTLSNNEPFTDSECLTNTQNTSDPNNSISINTLLRRINVILLGKQLKSVPVPVGTLKDQVVNPDQLLQERLRVANSFIRYSDNDAVKVIDIKSSAGHTILESEILEQIDSSYEAISKNSKTTLIPQSFNSPNFDLTNFPSAVANPSPFITGEFTKNLGFEYPNVELTGKFSEPKNNQENTQGKSPRYIRKQPNRQTRIEGDPKANELPQGVTTLKVMSLCFDLGGEQKTRTFITEEYGVTVQTIEEIWGFVFTGEDIYSNISKQYGTDPTPFWKCVKRVQTDYIYDLTIGGEGGTGYLIRKVGQGYTTVRWQQESTDKPETVGIAGDVSDYTTAKRELYTFFQIPILERHSRVLKLQPEYETNESDIFELIKKCNRDGTASYEPLMNPDYAPPYYIEHERTEKISFKSRSNPANDGRDIRSDATFEPDLYVGSIEVTESIITEIIPAKYEQKLIRFENGYPVYQRGKLVEPQKWFKYNYKYGASGQAIATAVEDVNVESGTGELPSVSERMLRYEKETPGEDPDTNKQKNEPTYKYLIRTAGYSQEDPINGSESFTLAETLKEALIAAKCKLAIENWRNGYSENLTINLRTEIKEGDRVFYFCNGQYRQRIVISVNHEFNILGNIDGSPVVTGQTKLTLGNLVYPNLEYSKIKLPIVDDSSKPKVVVSSVINEYLGGLLDLSTIKNRRNP